MSTIATRLASIHATIAEAAARSGRQAEDVALVAVSKTQPPEAVQEAIDAGQLLFGENRVQEARAKIPLLPARVRWHLIGHLQKNKIRQALPLFTLIESIDSLELALELDRLATEAGVFPRALLEVNVAGEGTKFGFAPDRLRTDLEALLRLERVQIEGLMCIPPPVPRAEDARRYFVALRELRDRLAAESGVPLPQLSMGMSGDFPVAVEEGATLVRVGSAIFGERKGKAWKPESATGFDE
jgi:pyridoxal phosphate enzyme (YggS family)